MIRSLEQSFQVSQQPIHSSVRRARDDLAHLKFPDHGASFRVFGYAVGTIVAPCALAQFARVRFRRYVIRRRLILRLALAVEHATKFHAIFVA
jgi:hypothetical protein